ncbi:hypothetical protein [Streptomyces lavendulae]|uniref:hypothetical protein n=1 Tax=Streptomyces lavendulae TaxID=1914 RepID=UPI00367E1E24
MGAGAGGEAAVPAAGLAPAATALAQHSHPAGAGVAAGLRAPTSSRVQAVTGDKKNKKSKKSKKKGGLFKKLMIVVLVVIVLLVVVYLVRRALRRRSA